MDRIKQFEPIFGEWYAESFIGAGSFGRVYKIYREELGNRFYSALKYISLPAENDEIRQLRFDGMDDASISTYYTDLAKDISSEITLMNKLRGNSNIVSFEDSKIIPKPNGMGYDIFIRMELLESLTNRASESAAAPEEAVKIGADICNALVRCQKNNIIHRDIKPDNIFVSEDGDYKLGDFGVARKLEKAATFMSKKGTYNYMAPEVYKGERYGATCDIYSLGLVMYRMLNRGRLPFLPPAPAPILTSDREQALLRRMNGERLPAPCDADPELARIILKACEYEPAKRYSAAADMRRELINYSAGMSSAPKAQRDNDPYEATGGAYTHAPAPVQHSINTDNYESTGGAPTPAPAQQQPEVNYDATSGVFGAAAAAEAVRHEAPDLDATSGVFSSPAKSEKAPEPEKHSFDPDATQSITTYKDRQKKAEPVKEEKNEKPAEPDKAPEPAPVKAEAKPEKPAGKKKTGLIVGIAAAALALVVGILAIAGVFGEKKDTGEQVANNTQGAAVVKDTYAYGLVDYAGLLTTSELNEVCLRLAAFSEENNLDIFIYTESSIGNSTAEQYAKKLYNDNLIGHGKSGILLFIAMDLREYYVMRYGQAAILLSDADEDAVCNSMVTKLSAGDYADAFCTFIYSLEQRLNHAQPAATDNASSTPLPEPTAIPAATPIP